MSGRPTGESASGSASRRCACSASCRPRARPASAAPRAAASTARRRIAERPAPRLWVATPDDAETVAELLGEFRDWWGYESPSDDSIHESVAQLIEDPATEFLLGAP